MTIRWVLQKKDFYSIDDVDLWIEEGRKEGRKKEGGKRIQTSRVLRLLLAQGT